MAKQISRAAELEKLIKQYQDSYYNGEAEVDDAVFDALWNEFKAIEPDNPVLQKIGADSGNFAKTRHVMPMGSQEKAANPDEFLKWAEKQNFSEYLVEHKFDGASLELQYEDGALVRAVTRGDGVIGDDITLNARKMRGVLTSLHKSAFTGGVRGEVIMTHEVHKKFYRDKANCRNAANGLMNRKDGNGSEHLDFIAYDAFSASKNDFGALFALSGFFADEEEKIAWLASCGFSVTPLYVCNTPQEVIALREEIAKKRSGLDYDIDGLVVKSKAIDFEDVVRARPEKQIAFKFSLEEAVTVVRGVEWSESGATYTPIAVFDPVELAGTRVKRANLGTPHLIRALDVKIGSVVVVTKRGEIIPKIERVLENPDGQTREVEFPTVCAVCGTAIVNDDTRLYCPNMDCPKRAHHRIEKWIQVLDIRDFGVTLIQNLFDAGKARSISALYKLRVSDLAPFFLDETSLSKEKKSLGAEKVIQSLYSKTRVPLAVFVAGFDIEGIGETLIERLVTAGFNTLEKLLAAEVETISRVNGFAEIMARALVDGLARHRDEMRFLVESKTITIETAGSNLAGKSFCFTGELKKIKRTEAEKMVRESGGAVKPTVTKGLSFLVTNDVSSGSSKNTRASDLGIPILNEDGFLKLFL
jgi:DNA ligase (NAD+)